MEVLHIKKKGQLLSTLERFHIYDLSWQKLQMNDTFTDTRNPIFDLIIKYAHHINKHLENPLPHHTPTHPQYYTTTHFPRNITWPKLHTHYINTN
jgi:hypothetical protein